MVRKEKSSQVVKLVETATRLFIEKGYRRTQMEDVTLAMGWSPGAVYRYVESKEALFDLTIRAGAMPGLLRPGLSPRAAARLIVEAVAFFRDALALRSVPNADGR